MERKNETECIENILELYSKAVFDNVGKTAFHAIFDTVKPNNRVNDFPDFFFEGGVLEHFEVSAGKEGRKGSSFKIGQAKSQREDNKETEEANKVFMESERHPQTCYVLSQTHKYENFSYQCFLESLKKNLESHIRSFLKSGAVGKAVVFVIENQSGQLTVWKDGRFIGFQCLAQDRGALEILREAAGKVRYVFYVSADRLECIDLSKIEGLIKSAPSGLDIRVGRKIEASIHLYIDL